MPNDDVNDDDDDIRIESTNYWKLFSINPIMRRHV